MYTTASDNAIRPARDFGSRNGKRSGSLKRESADSFGGNGVDIRYSANAASTSAIAKRIARRESGKVPGVAKVGRTGKLEERRACRSIVAAKGVRQDNMSKAAEGVSGQPANDKRRQAWPPRSCPWKTRERGGRHYAGCAARSCGSVTEGCQHTTARCNVASANAGVLRCTSLSMDRNASCVAGEKHPLNLIWIMPAQGSVRVLPRRGLFQLFSFSRISAYPLASSLSRGQAF